MRQEACAIGKQHDVAFTQRFHGDRLHMHDFSVPDRRDHASARA